MADILILKSLNSDDGHISPPHTELLPVAVNSCCRVKLRIVLHLCSRVFGNRSILICYLLYHKRPSKITSNGTFALMFTFVLLLWLQCVIFLDKT